MRRTCVSGPIALMLVALAIGVCVLPLLLQSRAVAELGSAPLDADGNGTADALTDGILIVRFLFGFRGEALVGGDVVPVDCSRCTAEEIEEFLASLLAQAAAPLDVDANESADALSDGILIIRFLFNFNGDALVVGAVAPDCQRCLAGEILPFLDELSDGALPDLVPIDGGVVPVSGVICPAVVCGDTPIDVTVSVKNEGSASAPSPAIKLEAIGFCHATRFQEVVPLPLAPGEVRVIGTRLCYTSASPYTVTVDPDDLIHESDETNNTRNIFDQTCCGPLIDFCPYLNEVCIR